MISFIVETTAGVLMVTMVHSNEPMEDKRHDTRYHWLVTKSHSRKFSGEQLRLFLESSSLFASIFKGGIILLYKPTLLYCNCVEHNMMHQKNMTVKGVTLIIFSTDPFFLNDKYRNQISKVCSNE